MILIAMTSCLTLASNLIFNEFETKGSCYSSYAKNEIKMDDTTIFLVEPISLSNFNHNYIVGVDGNFQYNRLFHQTYASMSQARHSRVLLGLLRKWKVRLDLRLGGGGGEELLGCAIQCE